MRDSLPEYRCPECRASLRWSMSNGLPGARTALTCANASSSTRIKLNTKKCRDFCFWEGVVIRQKDGSVKYCHKDGKTSLKAFKTADSL